MKPILATLIVLIAISFKAGADLYPSPGNGNNPGYPNYPSQPPQYPPQQPYPPPYQNYTTCKVEYTGSYYYVSKNGQRFTDLTSSLQQAINQQQNLENSGLCEYSAQSPGLCQLEYTGNYYYVSRNGNRLSDLVSDYRAALSTRDLLLRSRNCDQINYAPSAVCKVGYTGSYYYVSRNGSRFSDLVSNLNQVVQLRDDFARNYVCQVQYTQSPCRLEYTGNYYYISINNQRSTDLVADVNTMLNQQRTFSDRRLCSLPQPERCTLEYTGNYYYVARNSSRISDLMSNISQAADLQNRLRYSNNCY